MFNIPINKKLIKILIPVTIFIIFIIILLTLFVKNNEINKINHFSKNIVHINSSLKSKEKDGIFDSVTTCELLKTKTSSLNQLDSELNALNLQDSNLEILKSKLSDYLKLNISLYNSSLAILNNQNSEKFEILYKDLIKNEKAILLSTEDLVKEGVTISFPKESNIFFSDINKYVNKVYTSTREKDIKDEQKRDFLFIMNDIFNSFSSLKEDFKPALLKIREDKRDLSVLLCDISEKRSSFNDIKNKSYSISIPIGGDECYSSLEEMLNSYNSYINSLEESIRTEINLSNKSTIDSQKIIDLYTDAFDKHSDFLEYLKNFENAINSYKN